MKKNNMMRLAAVLLILVLLSTSVISGTFAKYTSQDSAADEARVAKWGMTVVVSGALFGSDYNDKSTAEDSNMISVSVSDSVHSSNTDRIVAPGTKSGTNMNGIWINIDAHNVEVAYQSIATAGAGNKDIYLGAGSWGFMVRAVLNDQPANIGEYYVLENDEYIVATTWTEGQQYYTLQNAVTLSDAYYPINWIVADVSDAPDITATKNLVAIAQSMATNLHFSKTAGTNFKAGYSLNWEWPFDGNDNADTILGYLAQSAPLGAVVYAEAAGGPYVAALDNGKYCLEVAFDFDLRVEQTD